MWESVVEFLKTFGGLTPFLVAVIGYFIKREFEKAKEVRDTTSSKIDLIFDKIDGTNDKIAEAKSDLKVVSANLQSHIEADDKHQEQINESMRDTNRSLNKINTKLQLT